MPPEGVSLGPYTGRAGHSQSCPDLRSVFSESRLTPTSENATNTEQKGDGSVLSCLGVRQYPVWYSLRCVTALRRVTLRVVLRQGSEGVGPRPLMTATRTSDYPTRIPAHSHQLHSKSAAL